MTRIRLRPALVAVVLSLATGTPAAGQALTGQLSGLLTDTGALTAGFVPDPAAAAATRDAVAGLFVVEFGALPLVSSSAGFVYQLNPALGVIERTSDNFGAFYTERAFRAGRHQTSFGIGWTSTSRFPSSTSRSPGDAPPRWAG